MEEDIRIAVFDGIDKKSFKDNKEYDGIEAMRILGACERKTLTCTYIKEILVPEEWMEDPVFPGYWEPEHWAPCQGTEFEEKYDVWINAQGYMLLAQPLPDNIVNINDFH